MTPSRPYLLRGLYEWIADNGMTPFISVNANADNVVIPLEYVKDGTIVLNISGSATKQLRIGNDAIEFQARFGGKVMYIYVPIPAVVAIFTKETQKGMVFSPADIEGYQADKTPDDSHPTKQKSKGKPKLSLVKNED